MAMNIIERNNVNIRGKGRQSIIFAHGYGCDQTIWNLVAPAFEEDYEVILFDHVGAGLSNISEYNKTKYSTLQGYANDILEIGQRLDLENTIFVGHSVSSMIGILAAIRNPSLFERLILIGPSPCYYDDEDYQGGFTLEQIREMLRFLESNYDSWARSIAPIIMGLQHHPSLGAQLAELFCRNRPEIAKHFAQVTFLSDNRRDLPKVKVPSLILQCSEDRIAPACVGRYVHSMLPNSEFHQLQATGHCPHVTAPEELIHVMQNYLGRRTIVASTENTVES